MKKTIINTINAIRNTVKKPFAPVSAKLTEEKGQFVMDHLVVFVIILVLAALAITLLTTYMNGDLSTLLKGKVNALFN